MPARFATFSSVVRSYPLSRTSARAASSNAARVRSRLSPFGFPRGDHRFSLVIDNKIVHLFYNLNTRTTLHEATHGWEEFDRGRAPGRDRGRATGWRRRAGLATGIGPPDCRGWTAR